MDTKKSIVSCFLLVSLSFLGIGCGGGDSDDGGGASPWAGKTYLLEIPDSYWTEPRGIGDDIGPFAPHFLISVEGGSASAPEINIGTAAGDAQDLCNPTTRVQATSSYPNVQISSSSFPVHIEHINEPIQVNGTIYNMTISNVLPDGDTITDAGELVATMDFRDVYRMFTALVDPTPDSVCDALADAYQDSGTQCEACPADGMSYCLTMKAAFLGAQPSNINLVTVAPSDVAASCSDSD